VSIAPTLLASRLNLGTTLCRQGELEQAEQCFRAVQPPTTEALECLLEVLSRQRNNDNSKSKYNDLVAVGRDIARLRLSAAQGRVRDARPAKVRIDRTTLCCVDCSQHDLAIHALGHSMERCEFDRVLFFTDRQFAVPGVEVVRIPRIGSSAEYSRFIVKDLNRHIRSAFVLVIQHDGYVLDAGQWSPQFQDYDYIGARWPSGGEHAVGNGGFSLRSKRLLEALQDDHISSFDVEDLAICLAYRPYLERAHGIKFAPGDLADRFSFEGIPRALATFGFHGALHLHALAGRSDAEIAGYRGERVVPLAPPAGRSRA
jgi:hypothetical protein